MQSQSFDKARSFAVYFQEEQQKSQNSTEGVWMSVKNYEFNYKIAFLPWYDAMESLRRRTEGPWGMSWQNRGGEMQV